MSIEITLLGPENVEAFRGLMPDSLWKQTDLGMGALADGVPVAVLLGRLQETELNLLFFYVEKEFRRQKIGTELLSEYLEAARYGNVDLVSIGFSSGEAATEELESILLKFGFFKDPIETGIFCVTLQDVSEVMQLRHTSHKEVMLLPLENAPDYAWYDFTQKILSNDEEDAVVPNLKDRTFYRGDSSFLLMEGNCVLGGILISGGEGVYALEYLCILSPRHPMGAMELMMESYQVLLKNANPSEKIVMNALGDTTERMIHKICNGKAVRLGSAYRYAICL